MQLFLPCSGSLYWALSPYFGTVVCFHGNGGIFPLWDYDSQWAASERGELWRPLIKHKKILLCQGNCKKNFPKEQVTVQSSLKYCSGAKECYANDYNWEIEFSWNAESVWIVSLYMQNVTSVLLLPQAMYFYSVEAMFPRRSSVLLASEAYPNSPNLCYIKGK